MKISINTDDAVRETNIMITCEKLTPEIEKVVSMLRILDMKLTGQKNNETFILDASEILYIDSADKKTFLYTGKDVYESNFRLYELEEQLSKVEFFRASKSSIINLKQIASLRADFDGRIIVTMTNGEKQIVSRQYASYLKKRLGVK